MNDLDFTERAGNGSFFVDTDWILGGYTLDTEWIHDIWPETGHFRVRLSNWIVIHTRFRTWETTLQYCIYQRFTELDFSHK